MKKILIGLGLILVLIVGALAAVPFLFPIDNLRPKIQAAAEKAVRGKVELGKLSLSVLPSLRVNVDGLKLMAPAPYDKEPMLTAQAVRLEMPLLSLLGSPRANIHLEKPVFKMIQAKPTSSAPVAVKAGEAPPPADTNL